MTCCERDPSLRNTSTPAAVIRDPASAARRSFTRSGKSLAAWPAALPVKSGAEFELQWPDAADNGKVYFVLVSAPPADLVATAQVLIENGCQNQLDLLVSSASKGGE